MLGILQLFFIYIERSYLTHRLNIRGKLFDLCSQMLGVEFVNRSPGNVDLEIAGRGQQQYRLIVTIPFDSTRKRMSVIVQAPDGSYTLYCKVSFHLGRGGDNESSGGISSHVKAFFTAHFTKKGTITCFFLVIVVFGGFFFFIRSRK